MKRIQRWLWFLQDRGHLDIEVFFETFFLHLAELYEVETFNLNKAVKRNIDRFPQDFMFQLTKEEADSLRFQIGMSKKEDQKTVNRKILLYYNPIR